MSSGFKLLVFDLDGTLIDSRLDLVHSVNAVLISLGREKLPVEVVLTFVGDGAQDLLKRSMRAAGMPVEDADAAFSSAFEFFIQHYLIHCLDFTLPYPGVIAVLEQFSHLPKAILTNKPLPHALKILDGLAMKDYFVRVLGGDGPHAKKPDPEGLIQIMSALKVPAGETLLIGDAIQDQQTARAAGCRFMAYARGIGDIAALEKTNPDFVLNDWAEFPQRIG
ncbi:MAG TPA: hypothetical protein DCQ83_00955 [Fibrobacteres bacterium]|jgi:phosphoglycolate phosphatase|nr:hypothetical protein [Fibrobacterota bacterium]